MIECTSVLKPTVSALICPDRGYLHSLVLPESQYVEQACSRAFGPHGRMAALTDDGRQWPSGYPFRPFTVLRTKHSFSYSRDSIKSDWAATPSAKSTLWTPHFRETLIRGSLEGRAAGDPKGASLICRRKLWASANALYKKLGLEDLAVESHSGSYKGLKRSRIYEGRRRVKKDTISCLVGWLPNETDDFSLVE
jgi:tRNA-specific adenosine deaminase 1